PIINSMRGDLKKIVEERGIGFNYESGNHYSLANCMNGITNESLLHAKANCVSFFTRELDSSMLQTQMHDFLKAVL
ncbi:hypothetical protein ACFL6N_03370, partial [Thermodesulfobacteriota bacterium]